MSRTIAELGALGNPFVETVATAKILVQRQSRSMMHQWLESDAPGLGALDSRTLAIYGVVHARQMGRVRGGIASTAEGWLFPPHDHEPGEVARVDVARVNSHAARGVTRTTVALMSPSLHDTLDWRSAIRIQVDSSKDGLQQASVEWLERQLGVATVDEVAQPIESRLAWDSYGPVALETLAAGDIAKLHRHPSVVHAIVPMVADCNRFLAELAAGTESASWTQVPLSPAAR